jgi:hypothetical protein
MPRQKWPARWYSRLGGALRYTIYKKSDIAILIPTLTRLRSLRPSLYL